MPPSTIADRCNILLHSPSGLKSKDLVLLKQGKKPERSTYGNRVRHFLPPRLIIWDPRPHRLSLPHAIATLKSHYKGTWDLAITTATNKVPCGREEPRKSPLKAELPWNRASKGPLP
jgi:hypothetical protein